MEKLTIRLNNVKDTYYGFVVAVLTYIKKKPSRQKSRDLHGQSSGSLNC